MKKISVLLFVLLLILATRSFAQNDGGVSIGKGSNPANQKSILELVSKTKGLLIPRMTDTERNAIFNGADQTAKGLMVFDDTRNAFYFWDGAAWKAIASGNVMTVSGTPGTPGTTGELVFDTQNSLLYIYDGGKWLKVGSDNAKASLASDVKVIPNTTVGLSSVNVQDALLELQDKIKTASGGGMNSVVHDASLSGSGTDGIPLTVAPGGISGSHLKDAAVTAVKISGGGNNKVLATDGAGTTVWIDKSSLGGGGGNSSSIITDKTLTGDGTASFPLGLKDGMVTASKISGGGIDKILSTDGTGNAVWIDKSSLGGSGGNSSSVITDKTLTGDGTALFRLGLASDAVTSDKIAFGAITSAKIEDDAVTSSKIHDFAITTAKIEDGAVSTSKLAFGAATAEKIGYRAITTEKIEEEAVTSSKILDGTIQAKDLGDMNAQDGYILQWKGGYGWLALPGNQGTGGGITRITPGTGLTGGGSVGDVTLGLSDGGVSTSKIADGAIQASKLGQMGATTSGQVLQWDGSVWKPATISGGTGGTVSVSTDATLKGNGTATSPLGLANGAIQAANLASMGATTSGQVLQWDGSVWKPATISGGAGSGTNLSASTTGTSMTINSSTGTSSAVIPIGSTSSAGLITAADKIKLDGITGNNTGDETAAGIRTKLGITTLTGSNTGDQTASTVSVTPTSTLTSLTVQAALIELQDEITAAASGGITSVSTDATLTGNGNTTSLGIASNGVTTIKIADKAVTLTKMADLAPKSLIGNSTTAAARPEAITVGSGLTLNGSVLSAGGTAGATGGDVVLAGQNYLTLSGQTLTAGAVDLSGTHATGILAAARFPALSGDVTTTAGSLTTSLNNIVTAGTASKITYNSKGLVTAGAQATTADIASVTDKRYVTDAQLATLGNTSGTNTGDQTLSMVGNTISLSGGGSVTGIGDITSVVAGTGLTGGGTSGDVTLNLGTNAIGASALKGSSGALGNGGGNGFVLQSNGDGTFSWKDISSGVAADPSSLALATGQFYIGDGSSKASAIAKGAIPLSGFGAAEATVDLGNNIISNVAAPASATDAVNKAYVDAKVPSTTAVDNGKVLSVVSGTPTWQTITGGGTVKTISVVDNSNGITGAVSADAVNPAITLTLGNIKPTSITTTGAISSGTTITATGAITGSNISSGATLSGTNTGDQQITLSGDVTGTGATKTTTITTVIPDGKITSAKILDGTIAEADMANGSVTPLKLKSISGSGTSGQAITSDGAGGFAWGSSGATTLTYTPGPASATLASSSGNTVTIGLVDASNAGLMKPSDLTKLTGLSNYSLPVATTTSLGGVKVAATSGLAVAGDGSLTANISTDGTFGSTLDTNFPSTKAVKTYVDGKVAAAGGGDAMRSSSLSQFASTTSAELAGVISNETGSGSGGVLVFSNSPTLTTPTFSAVAGTAPFSVTSTTPVTNLSIGGNAATATTASNIAGGAGGQILYQSAAGTTSKTATGTLGQVLTSNGAGAPTWTNSGTGDMSKSTYDPAGINQQLVGTTANQILTNKELTSPKITTPTGLVKSDVGLGNVQNVDQTNASNLTSGIVPTARLGSGTANATTFLAGDGTWKTAGGSSTTDLTYTAFPSKGTVYSSTGADADILEATTTNAGLLNNTDKTKLTKIPDITNTPAAGNVLTATSATSATWQAPAAGGGGGGSTIYKALNQAGTADVPTVLVKGSGPKIKFWIETAATNIFHISIPNGAIVDYIRIYTIRTDMSLSGGFYYCYVDVKDDSGNTNNNYLDALMPSFSYVILNRLNATEAPWSTTTVPLAGTNVENCNAGTLHINIALGTAEIPDVSDGGTYIILSY